MTDSNITLTATEFSVSVSEKRSTGDYENVEAFASLNGEIPAREGDIDEASRRAIRAKLLALHKDLQEVVERSADNRVAVSEAEDWGVPKHDDADDPVKPD